MRHSILYTSKASSSDFHNFGFSRYVTILGGDTRYTMQYFGKMIEIRYMFYNHAPMELSLISFGKYHSTSSTKVGTTKYIKSMFDFLCMEVTMQ